ncbi:MAG: pantetheine-phosphate adenylyltransferase [Bacillota bacterium]|nr:pantetheine-phosphate adenylyltransferase [Bacillota bacterium]
MRIVVYPGSFDPPTNGHLDIIERAAALFDRVIVAVAVNLRKEALFSVEERVAMLKEATLEWDNVEVDSYRGLTVKYALQRGASAIVRGLRVLSDFENEYMMALMNRKLDSGIETIFMMTSKEYAFLSSSAVRELAELGGDFSDLVPPCVSRKLVEKFSARWRGREE